jgi:hypothetical protein
VWVDVDVKEVGTDAGVDVCGGCTGDVDGGGTDDVDGGGTGDVDGGGTDDVDGGGTGDVDVLSVSSAESGFTLIKLSMVTAIQTRI